MFSDKTGSKVVGDPELGKATPIKREGKGESIEFNLPASSYSN
jgi:hypothetical protein